MITIARYILISTRIKTGGCLIQNPGGQLLQVSIQQMLIRKLGGLLSCCHVRQVVRQAGFTVNITYTYNGLFIHGCSESCSHLKLSAGVSEQHIYHQACMFYCISVINNMNPYIKILSNTNSLFITRKYTAKLGYNIIKCTCRYAFIEEQN